MVVRDTRDDDVVKVEGMVQVSAQASVSGFGPVWLLCPSPSLVAPFCFNDYESSSLTRLLLCSSQCMDAELKLKLNQLQNDVTLVCIQIRPRTVGWHI